MSAGHYMLPLLFKCYVQSWVRQLCSNAGLVWYTKLLLPKVLLRTITLLWLPCHAGMCGCMWVLIARTHVIRARGSCYTDSCVWHGGGYLKRKLMRSAIHVNTSGVSIPGTWCGPVTRTTACAMEAGNEGKSIVTALNSSFHNPTSSRHAVIADDTLLAYSTAFVVI